MVTSRSGAGVRQRPQHHGVDDGEDGGRRAGAETEDQHGDEREARMVANLAGGGAKGVEHGRLRAAAVAAATRGPAQCGTAWTGQTPRGLAQGAVLSLTDLCQDRRALARVTLAGVAQLVEQLIRNQQVVRSIRIAGSIFLR